MLGQEANPTAGRPGHARRAQHEDVGSLPAVSSLRRAADSNTAEIRQPIRSLHLTRYHFDPGFSEAQDRAPAGARRQTGDQPEQLKDQERGHEHVPEECAVRIEERLKRSKLIEF